MLPVIGEVRIRYREVLSLAWTSPYIILGSRGGSNLDMRLDRMVSVREKGRELASTDRLRADP
jgi:hypothetical protein